MTDDGQQIRTLIEHWAAAVHSGDMNGVLADHSEDIVMFDVPPPYDGVRGIDAYRQTWPPFFEWQARGASFEVVSLWGHRRRRRGLCPRPAALRNSAAARRATGEPPTAYARPAQAAGSVGRRAQAPFVPARQAG
jgi:SnoaL-like domain